MTNESVLFGLDLSVYAISFGVIIIAAIAQSSLGVGFGVVAAPILALIDPAMLPIFQEVQCRRNVKCRRL